MLTDAQEVLLEEVASAKDAAIIVLVAEKAGAANADVVKELSEAIVALEAVQRRFGATTK